uniref:Uncharacterized protein n=1 Tax=Rhizophagus irregularis (strain DAOM 181602 / DAOM 197198 / MUCL 43194) TaxID=747089 RepID=U9TXK9_RHIID
MSILLPLFTITVIYKFHSLVPKFDILIFKGHSLTSFADIYDLSQIVHLYWLLTRDYDRENGNLFLIV